MGDSTPSQVATIRRKIAFLRGVGAAGQDAETQEKGVKNSRRKDATKKTSLELFREFMKILPDGTVDASRIVSRECYDAWILSRRQRPTEPEKIFQRTLTSHLTAIDGRAPFRLEEEIGILHVLRAGTRWPCFADCPIRFGCSGFRAFGYHEQRRLAQQRFHLEGKTPFSRSKRLRLSESSAEEALIESSPEALIESSPNNSPACMFEPVISQPSEGSFTFVDPQLVVDNPLRRMHKAVQQVLSHCSSISWQSWCRGAQFVRLLVLGTGCTHHPSNEDAQDLMKRLNSSFPGHALHVINLTEPLFANRFMIQNELSRLCFGRITKMDGGLEAPLICDWTEAHKALLNFERAFNSKGKQAFVTRHKLKFVNCDSPFEREIWNYCNEQGSLLGYAIQLPPWLSTSAPPIVQNEHVCLLAKQEARIV